MRAAGFLTLTAVATTAVVLSGCVRERLSSGEVHFTGRVSGVATRVGGADGTLWMEGDPVGIYMIKAEPGSFSEGNVQAANKRYTASIVGGANEGVYATLEPSDGVQLCFPLNGDKVKFAACHPYTASVTADYKMPFSVADQSDLSAIDVLHAPVTQTSYNCVTAATVPLVFAHKLSKLVFVISNGAGIVSPAANGMTVSISEQKTAGTLDLATGVVEATGAAQTLTAKGTSTVEAIVMPMDDLWPVKFSFTNSAGQNFIVYVPQETPRWDGGYLYTYRVTLKAADKPVHITGTITPWNDGGTYPVEAEQVKLNYRVTWDPDDGGRYILTDDATDAGLYFKFGGVAGVFSGGGGVAALPGGANGDTFDEGDMAWNPTGASAWADIPSYAAADYSLSPNTITVPVYHNAANVKAGKGDPCRLVGLDLEYIAAHEADELIESDIDNGYWRLPTVAEQKLFSGRTSNATYTDHWTTLSDSGVVGGMFPDTRMGDIDTFLPAAGYRDGDTGRVSNQGVSVNYLSSTPRDATRGCNLYFIDNYVAPSNSIDTAFGFTVRCVRQ